LVSCLWKSRIFIIVIKRGRDFALLLIKEVIMARKGKEFLESVSEVVKFVKFCVSKKNLQRYLEDGYEEEKDVEEIKKNVPVECRTSHVLMKKKVV
jgi:hypothetical protein